MNGLYSRLPPRQQKARKSLNLRALKWLREPDLNRRPSGYEPDELPDCSIPHGDYAWYIESRKFFLRCSLKKERSWLWCGDFLFLRSIGVVR